MLGAYLNIPGLPVLGLSVLGLSVLGLPLTQVFLLFSSSTWKAQVGLRLLKGKTFSEGFVCSSQPDFMYLASIKTYLRF